MTQATPPWRSSLRLEHVAVALAVVGALLLISGFRTLFEESSARVPEAAADTSALTPAPLVAAQPLNTTPLPGPTETAPEPSSPLLSTTTVVPARVRIPVIGVDATIVDLGLDGEGRLEVPDDWDHTGWFTGRSVPGEAGTSIVVGHVDSAANGPAVFYHLDELIPGDLVEVVRSDGSIAQFTVTEVTQFTKDDFPTDRVYAPTEQPTLRLITCGGAFDRKARSYLDNVVVFAEHLGTRLPSQRQS